MHISEVFRQDEYEAQNIVPDFSFDCLETDAAHITPTSLFFLLPGVFRDTDVLLPFVLSKKPACVVTEREIKDSHGVPILKVKNARRAFAFAAYRFYHADNVTFPLIGITGTNGKTTVATEIARLLEAGGKKVGVIGTGCMKIGNKPLTDPYYGMTTPDPPLLYSGLSVMQKEGCDAVIIEVSSHALALEKVSPLCFSIGVFLGLSEEHLDFHVDMENYYQAKKKLFSQTKKAFINVDNAYGKRLYQEIYCEKKSVGIYNNSDIKPTNIRHLGLLGSSFLYEDGEVIFPLSTPLPGDCQITDTLFSCAVSLSIHIPVETIKNGMKSMLPVPGRMEKVSDSPIVYLDYAHTPNSLEFALNTLFSNKMTGQKIILVVWLRRRARSQEASDDGRRRRKIC